MLITVPFELFLPELEAAWMYENLDGLGQWLYVFNKFMGRDGDYQNGNTDVITSENTSKLI